MALPHRRAVRLFLGIVAGLAWPLAALAQDVAPQVICPESTVQDPVLVQSTCEPAPEPSYRYAPTLSLAPHHPDYVNPSLCEGCFDAVVTYSTPAYTSLDQERNLTLMFANAQARRASSRST